jgi:hypothetical protein
MNNCLSNSFPQCVTKPTPSGNHVPPGKDAPRSGCNFLDLELQQIWIFATVNSRHFRPCVQRCFKDGTRLPEVNGTSKSNRSSHFHRRGLACVGATVLGSFVVTGVIFAIGGI